MARRAFITGVVVVSCARRACIGSASFFWAAASAGEAKTARTLGLSIPQSLLLQADEVIR